MYSEEVDKLRKELFHINTQIAFIEKNHHLDGKEKEEAEKRLKELIKLQEDIRYRLRHTMYEDIEKQSRGGRR